MGRTAIVFGGSGFFGTHLCRALSADPLYGRIIVADLREPREIGPKVEFIMVDVRQPIALSVSGDIEIYNFAAVHVTPGHPDWEYYWGNVGGAIEVCRFAERVGAGRIVFTSSISVFGGCGDRVDDRTAPQPVTPYGQSKFLAEKIHENWQQAEAGRQLTVVRPAVTFGEGERGNFARLAQLLRRGLFVYPARKTTIKACAPIEDFAACLRFMSETGERYVNFIYAYPERTTTEAINTAFHEAAGFKRPWLVFPEWLAYGGAMVFEALNAFGLKTSINRARIGKLVQATDAYPSELVARGWVFRLTLTEALRRWKQASGFK